MRYGVLLIATALVSAAIPLVLMQLRGSDDRPGAHVSSLPATRSSRQQGYVPGMSLAHLHARGVGYGSDACREQLAMLAKDLGVRSVSLTNFAYMPAVNSPVVSYGRDRSMMQRDLAKAVSDAHEAGMTVLLKPDIWSREFWGGNGVTAKWHGDIAMASEADWDSFFKSYGEYVLATAKLAQDAHAEMLSVGVELVGTSKQTARWKKLIADVRQVYKGKVTYSCAFTEWKQVEFFDDLDVIGIAAYFPLVDKDRASEEELRAGWRRVYGELEPLAKRTGKKIFFTELGYTAAPKAGKEPWSYEVAEEDEAYQARLFRVALQEAGKHECIEGMYLWKWFTAGEWQRYEHDDPFALQGREKVIEVLKEEWVKRRG